VDEDAAELKMEGWTEISRGNEKDRWINEETGAERKRRVFSQGYT